MNNAIVKVDMAEISNFKCCRDAVNPYSLLNWILPGKNIKPLQWLMGFLFISQFVAAFADIDNSYYLTNVFKLSLLALVWFFMTVLVENTVLSHLMTTRQICYIARARMMLISVALWSVSIFLYISAFLI